jgi:hypothetical protein
MSSLTAITVDDTFQFVAYSNHAHTTAIAQTDLRTHHPSLGVSAIFI